MPLRTADRVPWSPLPSPGVDPSRGDILETALVHTQLWPRNLADRMTEHEGEILFSGNSKYRLTRAPYTTGMVHVWQPNGKTNTIQTGTGYDNRTAMELMGNISIVHPQLMNAYTREHSVDPDNPVLMTWAAPVMRRIGFRFVPEPAGVALLAAGFANLTGLYRLLSP